MRARKRIYSIQAAYLLSRTHISLNARIYDFFDAYIKIVTHILFSSRIESGTAAYPIILYKNQGGSRQNGDTSTLAFL